MTMAKARDYRDQSSEELEASYEDIRKELFQLKNETRRSKKVDKPHLFRQKRKDLARLLTVINEKRLASQ
jgi:large subunit ribosomal protein L29